MFTEMKKAGKRAYVLRARGERLAETRTRIVEAIMRLHEEVGPRHTTVSAIAARAGVERLTVYRHFRDEAAMFTACSQHHLGLNPPPQAEAWKHEPDPVSRTRRGLEEIYAYFGRTHSMFEKIYRDADEYESLRQILERFDAHLRGLADDLAGAWPKNERERSTLILRHAVKFSTWQAFAAEGVGDARKIALLLEWLGAPEGREKEARTLPLTSGP